jgi:hypothetical protein
MRRSLLVAPRRAAPLSIQHGTHVLIEDQEGPVISVPGRPDR